VRLLFVEDNDQLAELVADALVRAGFTVDRMTLADEALAALAVAHYAAVVLDLSLPDADGTTVLAAMRRKGDATPVLILTARDDLRARVDALNGGADDYLVKPFEMEELVARLKALLRRPGQILGATLSLGRVTFDTTTRQVLVGGAPLDLTPRERDVFEHLMRRAGKVLTKTMLEEALYGFEDSGSANSVEVAIHRLRRKLAKAQANLEIHTMRGVGYLLADASPDGA